jgi:hypothetical protein
MMRHPGMKAAALLLGLLAFAPGCASSNKKIVQEDFAEGRVVDLSITEKLTGNRELLFVSIPKKSRFLDGYIQGVITDFSDNPVQGVVVRAVASGENQMEDTEIRSAGLASTSFDPGVSDTNGFYRVRFSLPIIGGVIDVRGRLMFNPGWEQERENLGKAYEPQMKQSQFRFYYEKKHGRLIFAEGIRKTIVTAVTSGRAGKASPLPGGKAGEAKGSESAPAAGAKPGDKGDEDIFKGFGLGQ